MRNVLRKSNIRRLALACALGTACMPATAFKPAYEAHGHTMITRSVLSLGGYSFGSDGLQPLTTERFRYRYSTSANDQFAHAAAVDHIAAGVQTRDWGRIARSYALTDTSFQSAPFSWAICDASAPYFGVANAAERMGINFQPSDGATFPVCLITSMDVNTDDGHFDNDNFIGSLNSIRTHLALATTYAKVWANSSDKTGTTAHANRLGARLMLGKAIHTLQDFYAHSNWIEEYGVRAPIAEFITNNVITGQALSTQTLAGLASQSQRKVGATFPSNNGGSVASAACLGRQVIPSTLTQDTWGANDGNYLGYQILPGIGPPPSSTIGFVTTGAWWDGLVAAGTYDSAAASDEPGRSRCDHGVSDDAMGSSGNSSFSKFSGIAKDLPGWPPSPSPSGRITGAAYDLDESYVAKGEFVWQILGVDLPDDAKVRAQSDATELHLGASFAAARHTKVMLERFANEFVATQTSSALETDLVLSAIFGSDLPSRREIFVVDRSGTMSEILPEIKQTLNRTLRDGVDYVLVDFAGADSPGGQTNIEVRKGNAAVIRARLSELTARGGGGCLTPSWEAIRAGVSASGMGGDLYLLTDASASDANEASTVKAQAQAKRIRLHQYVTGSCSPLDESYVLGSRDTGGGTHLVEHSAEAITQMFETNHNTSDIFHVVHSEMGNIAGTRTVTFPVETGVGQLRVVGSGSLDNFQVLSPSGQIATAGPSVKVTQTLNSWTVVVDSPLAGVWQTSATGNGSYALTASVNGPIDFDVIERSSVQHVGRPGHEYRAPLGQPGQAGRVWLRTRVINGRAPLQLDLVRTDGSVIFSSSLSQSAANYFEGEITLPTEPHRFRVRGLTDDGALFARTHGQGSVAPPAPLPGAVSANLGAAGTWRAGTVNAFAINLKNLGGDDTVSFASGTLPTGATLTCNPSSISVPGSEQVNVLCSISLPEAPDRADFGVVVSSTTAVPTVAQTVTIPLTPLKLPLSCALDIDGDNRVDPAVDGVLLTRYLLGFRGAALTNGLTIPGPRKTDALLAAFFGNAAQFDLVGRASPAPTATVDGLLMTRLMLGFDDSSLLSGINIPAGAQFVTAAAIKDNVIAKCAGGF